MRQNGTNAVIRRFLRHRLAVISLILLLFLTLLAVLAPLITPYPPTKSTGKFSQPPTPEHWLGTDKIGRDMFSRILFGMRASLTVGFLATLLSTVIGVILGLLSGFFGGIIDRAVMSFTDMVMSFPYILLVLVGAAVFEPGMTSIVLILGFVDWPGVARLVRGNTLSLRETGFIKSDITAGLPRSTVLFAEILPNTLAPVLVYMSSVFALSVLDEAALSFLGMGIQPPTPSLGNLLGGAESLSVLTGKPWLWLPAGIVIALLVVCINFVGDALRDALDPRNILR